MFGPARTARIPGVSDGFVGWPHICSGWGSGATANVQPRRDSASVGLR